MMHVFLTALALLFWVILGHGHTWVFSALAISAIWNDYRQRHTRALVLGPAAVSEPVNPAPVGQAAPVGHARHRAHARSHAPQRGTSSASFGGANAAPLRRMPPVRAYRRNPAASGRG